MLGTHDLPLFIASGLLLNISPGPDTAFIVGRSTQLGWRAGATAALGIGTGGLVHVLSASVGLSALLAASATAFAIMKFLGATYLIYLGVKMLFSRQTEPRPESISPNSQGLRVIFRQGFLTNVLNPKVALFFLAFVPQFIDADAPSKVIAFGALGLIFDVNGTLWNLGVAWISARAAMKFRSAAKMRRWIDFVLGGLFISLGLKLALLERSQ
jgi:threonine/homoserine/homoserine lactone efflux protein